MELNKEQECARAGRIIFITTFCHDRITDMYENLVDRHFEVVEVDVREMITELKLVIKSLENDEF